MNSNFRYFECGKRGSKEDPKQCSLYNPVTNETITCKSKQAILKNVDRNIFSNKHQRQNGVLDVSKTFLSEITKKGSIDDAEVIGLLEQYKQRHFNNQPPETAEKKEIDHGLKIEELKQDIHDLVVLIKEMGYKNDGVLFSNPELVTGQKIN